jgi:hypothetical protein
VTAAPDGKQDPSEWLGKTLGKYRDTQLHGEGGMEIVRKGVDGSIDDRSQSSFCFLSLVIRATL